MGGRSGRYENSLASEEPRKAPGIRLRNLTALGFSLAYFRC
jgi:hypothetical protein